MEQALEVRSIKEHARDTNVKKNLKVRKKELNRKSRCYTNKLQKETKIIKNLINDSFEKAVYQRRKNFEAMWTRFEKVSKSIINI